MVVYAEYWPFVLTSKHNSPVQRATMTQNDTLTYFTRTKTLCVCPTPTTKIRIRPQPEEKPFSVVASSLMVSFEEHSNCGSCCVSVASQFWTASPGLCVLTQLQ